MERGVEEPPLKKLKKQEQKWTGGVMHAGDLEQSILMLRSRDTNHYFIEKRFFFVMGV